MTDDELSAIEALAEAATPGPWKYDWGNWDVEGPMPDRYVVAALDASSREPSFGGQEPNPVAAPTDGEFIAHARTDVPRLVAEVRRLQKHTTPLVVAALERAARLEVENARLRDVVEAIKDAWFCEDSELTLRVDHKRRIDAALAALKGAEGE